MRGIGVICLLILLCLSGWLLDSPNRLSLPRQLSAVENSKRGFAPQNAHGDCSFFSLPLATILRQAKSLEPKQWQRKAQGYTLGFFVVLWHFRYHLSFLLEITKIAFKFTTLLFVNVTFYFCFRFSQTTFCQFPHVLTVFSNSVL